MSLVGPQRCCGRYHALSVMFLEPGLRASAFSKAHNGPAVLPRCQTTNKSQVAPEAAMGTAATRGVPVESLAPFRAMLVGGIVQSMDEKSRDAWARLVTTAQQATKVPFLS